jgi:hypothetical protein
VLENLFFERATVGKTNEAAGAGSSEGDVVQRSITRDARQGIGMLDRVFDFPFCACVDNVREWPTDDDMFGV